MGDEARTDPLYRDPGLIHHVTLPIMGHAVSFATNSDDVLQRIERSYGQWRDLSASHVSTSALKVTVVLHDGEEHADVTDFQYRMPNPQRLLVHTPGSLGVIEIDNRHAYAYVTQELIDRADFFRWGMLEAMTLMLVTSIDRCPFHAAAVRKDDHLILLMGTSGSGKSTLAYTLHAAGYDVLSDDTVYVQMRPQPRIWCIAEHITLMPSVAAKLSDLRDVAPQQLPTGKIKVIVPLPSRTSAPFLAQPRICILQRAERATLEAMTSHAIHTVLDRHVEPGFELLASQRSLALRWLCSSGGWRLQLSSDPTDAVPLIHELLSH